MRSLSDFPLSIFSDFLKVLLERLSLRTQIVSIYKLLPKKSALVILAFLYVFCSVTQAHGSIVSVVTGFLSNVGVIADNSISPASVSANSQNMALLQAASGVEATSSLKSELDMAIVEGSAVLAESGPLGTIADVSDGVPPSDAISVYTVRQGDRIENIAKMYNVSANTIRWANDLKKGAVLKEGSTLVILPISGVQYTVKKGDTVKGIAKKYGGDIDEIVAYNDIDLSKGLIVGDTIIIPDGEIDSASASTKPGSKTGTSKYKGPSYPGYFQAPLARYTKTQGIHGHNAVDLAAPMGTPMYAAAGGTVIIAKTTGYNGGYGMYVVISHPNGTQTLYGHMSAVMVSPGEKVGKGDRIGSLGSSGNSTGPHVHFEVRGATNPF